MFKLRYLFSIILSVYQKIIIYPYSDISWVGRGKARKKGHKTGNFPNLDRGNWHYKGQWLVSSRLYRMYRTRQALSLLPLSPLTNTGIYSLNLDIDSNIFWVLFNYLTTIDMDIYSIMLKYVLVKNKNRVYHV